MGANLYASLRESGANTRGPGDLEIAIKGYDPRFIWHSVVCVMISGGAYRFVFSCKTQKGKTLTSEQWQFAEYTIETFSMKGSQV